MLPVLRRLRKSHEHRSLRGEDQVNEGSSEEIPVTMLDFPLPEAVPQDQPRQALAMLKEWMQAIVMSKTKYDSDVKVQTSKLSRAVVRTDPSTLDAIWESVQIDLEAHVHRTEKYRDRVGAIEALLSVFETDLLAQLDNVAYDEATSSPNHNSKQESTKRNRNDQPPDHLLCPITLDIMTDPVVAMDGHTYERHAIEEVYRATDRPKSPKTGEILVSNTLIPNVTVRCLAREWQEKREAGR